MATPEMCVDFRKVDNSKQICKENLTRETTFLSNIMHSTDLQTHSAIDNSTAICSYDEITRRLERLHIENPSILKYNLEIDVSPTLKYNFEIELSPTIKFNLQSFPLCLPPYEVKEDCIEESTVEKIQTIKYCYVRYCPECFDDFTDNDVMILCCERYYHKKCIFKMFREHKPCLECRKSEQLPSKRCKAELIGRKSQILKIYDNFFKENDCAICLENFTKENDFTYLTCKHFFHRQCIERWIESSNTCPKCRTTQFGKTHKEERPRRLVEEPSRRRFEDPPLFRRRLFEDHSILRNRLFEPIMDQPLGLSHSTYREIMDAFNSTIPDLWLRVYSPHDMDTFRPNVPEVRRY